MLRKSNWILRADTAFDQVISACALTPRPGQDGTWITREMLAAYRELHRLGHAHSVEVFDGDALVGGIYGVAIGRMFFGESMFSGESGGSKVALAGLAQTLRGWGWPLIDAQVENPHLQFMGAQSLPRREFLARIGPLVEIVEKPGLWSERFGLSAASVLA